MDWIELALRIVLFSLSALLAFTGLIEGNLISGFPLFLMGMGGFYFTIFKTKSTLEGTRHD